MEKYLVPNYSDQAVVTEPKLTPANRLALEVIHLHEVIAQLSGALRDVGGYCESGLTSACSEVWLTALKDIKVHCDVILAQVKP